MYFDFRTVVAGSLFGVCISLVVVGCSIRENPPKNSQFNIKASQLGCLDSAGTQIERFIQGTATEKDIDDAWSCATQALEQFTSKVRGNEAASYSAEELRQFLSKYFVRQIKLTDGLVARVGELKQAMVGGSVDRITDGEIQELEQIFEVFRVQSLTLRSYMPLNGQAVDGKWNGLGGKVWKDLTANDLEILSSAIITAANQLGGILGSNGKPYSFDQFDHLLQAIIDSLPADQAAGVDYLETRKFLTNIRSHLGLISQVKTSFLMPTPDRTDGVCNPSVLATTSPDALPDCHMLSDGKDWKDLLTTSASWGSVAIWTAWYFDSDRQALSGETQTRTGGIEGLQLLRKIFDSANSIFTDVVNRHVGQLIPFEELENLVALVPAGVLPAQTTSVNLSLRPFFQRIVGGMDLGPDGRAAQGITPGILKKLNDTFYNWYEGQLLIETLFQRIQSKNGDSDGASYLGDTLLNSQVATGLWNEIKLQTNPEWNPITQLAARRIQLLISPSRPQTHSSLRPLFHGDEGEISFSRSEDGQRYSFHDLSELNWMQSLSRTLLRGYAEKDAGEPALGSPMRADVDDWQTTADSKTGEGINFTEFSRFFSDFRPIGIDLKLFDPDAQKSAFNRFREADVFLDVSDGNAYLDLAETTTLLAYDVSAYRKADRIHSEIAAQCENKPHADKYGEALIEPTCYRQKFFANFQQIWDEPSSSTSQTEGLVQYYNGLESTRRSLFQSNLEDAGRKGGFQETAWFDSDDTQGIVAGLQYVEAIMVRYDVHNQGYLGPSESDGAFPVFKRTLQQLGRCNVPAQNLNDFQASLVFTYMLAKGVTPGGAWDLGVWYAEEELQKWIPLFGQFKADRIQILQIFANLSDASNNASVSNTACSRF